MTIGKNEVLHVARLAELAVPEEELDRLVGQMNRIVDYVAQLNEVPADRMAEPFLPGPAAAPLRDDIPGADPLHRSVQELAPELREGLILVPRHGAMEDQ